MGAGDDLLRICREPPDQRIFEQRFAVQRGVMSEAQMDRQPLRQQHLGGDTVYIPGVPSAGQALLNRLVLG